METAIKILTKRLAPSFFEGMSVVMAPSEEGGGSPDIDAQIVYVFESGNPQVLYRMGDAEWRLVTFKHDETTDTYRATTGFGEQVLGVAVRFFSVDEANF